ncbi:hypothetical protein P154DRAFT_566568 [Amniculicola lignicola CBS 123094]|uniref:DUF7730 domain-containing protein n=1 Tax=Amniculicola lignicola CBS 123094 TaxID=1392246 RepID=A0A6A5W497_9PLEO|nr:hypothetical protein P154DRAFT_566568 [Amniculicola lignicola CBS 123094]
MADGSDSPRQFDNMLTSDVAAPIEKKAKNRARKKPKPYRVYTAAQLKPYWRFRKIYHELKWAKPVRGSPFPFLQLPAELRQMVYINTLVVDSPFEFWPEEESSDYVLAHVNTYRKRVTNFRKLEKLIKRRGGNLRLLRTCKQVNMEASPVFYGENQFRFSGRDGHTIAYCFTWNMGWNRLQWLTNITIGAPFGESDLVSKNQVDKLQRHLPFRMPHDGVFLNDPIKTFSCLVNLLIKRADGLKKFTMVVCERLRPFPRQNKYDEKKWRDLKKLVECKPFVDYQVVCLYHETSTTGDFNHLNRFLKRVKSLGIWKFYTAHYEEDGLWQTHGTLGNIQDPEMILEDIRYLFIEN